MKLLDKMNENFSNVDIFYEDDSSLDPKKPDEN